MDPVLIYGIAAGGVFVICLLSCASSYISRWFQDRTLFYIFKYLIYPIFIRRTRLWNPISRWHAVLMTLYWLGTGVCNLIRVNTVVQAGNRAGALAVVQLIPLLCTNRAAMAADFLGFSLETYVRLHTSFGLMAFLQSLIHITVFLTHNTFDVKESLQFFGLLGAVAIASLTLLSMLQMPLFEFFQKTHYALAALIAYAVWRHLSVRSASSRVYIIVAGSIFAFTTITRYARLILHNVRWRRPYATTSLTQVRDAIRVQIEVTRPWKVRAGEFVYVWMPGVSFWSSFQSHPFMISWWDQDVDGKASRIYLLVKPASGFTQKMTRQTGTDQLKAWVDGPYGQIQDVGDYGSVAMFATGIGIAAQVPYIKQLLKGYQDSRVRTKSILLVWQLDKESDQEWVQDWMDELLSEDKGAYILRIRLYVLRNFDDKTTTYGTKEDYGQHERVKKFYGKPDLEKLIEAEVEKSCGRLLISTSTESDMQDRIQKLTQTHLNKDVNLIHLVFQPREYQSLWSSKAPEITYQGVV